jgi:hypothetical protein
LIPKDDPITAFNLQIIAVIVIFVVLIRNVRIDSGANFCHVDKIMHVNQESDDITEGNQKWYGTIPNLINIDDISINIIIVFIGTTFHMAVEDIKRILDPRACAKKYFNIASVS